MRLDSIAVTAPHLIKRLEHFRNFTMAHPRLVEARDELADAIDGAAPGSLVLVLGPTGVGKTTLRLKVENLLMQQMAPAMAADPGRLPFVSVEVVPPDTGQFRWRDYFSRLLAAMNEPLIDFKTMRGTGYTQARSTLPSIVGGRELGYAVEQALLHRHPPVVFVDEAQHLARIASGRRLSDQLDVIKSIANRTETVHVLLGTYELLAFRNLSAQLSRRSMDLHFQRYRAESAEDRQVFCSILLTFQKQLQVALHGGTIGQSSPQPVGTYRSHREILRLCTPGQTMVQTPGSAFWRTSQLKDLRVCQRPNDGSKAAKRRFKSQKWLWLPLPFSSTLIHNQSGLGMAS